MKTYIIDTADHGEVYLIFVPEHVANTIEIKLDDGYGGNYDSTLDRGFHTAICFHSVHAIGHPKTWQIGGTAHTGNVPETDSRDIKGIKITALKELMGIES